MSSIVMTFKRYAVFTGRASRREFWMFLAFWMLVMMLLKALENATGLVGVLQGHQLGWLSSMFWMLGFMPLLAVTVRRLHDAGRSGWWVLSQIVPVVGGLVLLVLLAMPGAEAL